MYTKEKIDKEQESVLCNDTAFTIQLGKKNVFFSKLMIAQCDLYRLDSIWKLIEKEVPCKCLLFLVLSLFSGYVIETN